MEKRAAIEKEMEKDPEKYYSGTGYAEKKTDASTQALQDMMSGIVSYVYGDTHIDIVQKDKNGNITSSVETASVVKTFSSGYVKNVKTISCQDKEGKIAVFCYMKRDEFTKLVSERREQVLNELKDAMRAEKDGKIDEALRKLAKSRLLLLSLPDPSEITYDMGSDFEKETRVLIDWIPEKTREILNNMTVDVGQSDEEGTHLFVKYKNDKPVTSARINYDNGLESHYVTAKNGMCIVETGENFNISDLALSFEYAFERDIATTKVLKDIAQLFPTQELDEAKIKMPKSISKSAVKATQKEIATAAQELATISDIAQATNHVKSYIDIVMQIDAAIRKKDYGSVRNHFTDEGYEMYDKLLRYGKAKILQTPKELHVYTYRPTDESETKFICRSIPMQFSYGRQRFVEDVTFTFNSDHKIECVAFGLDKPTRDQIYTNEHLDSWGENICTMLATFIENYQTAWALKRLDYIESIFADDARIITGHVLKQIKDKNFMDDNNRNKVTFRDGIKYTEMEKHQYMDQLREVFDNNPFINLTLTDCLVMRLANENMFGINIHQDYFSSTYSDTGFLCLLIDVQNPEQPQIKFRTWQPKRDPSINAKNPDDPFWGVITGAQFQ